MWQVVIWYLEMDRNEGCMGNILTDRRKMRRLVRTNQWQIRAEVGLLSESLNMRLVEESVWTFNSSLTVRKGEKRPELHSATALESTKTSVFWSYFQSHVVQQTVFCIQTKRVPRPLTRHNLILLILSRYRCKIWLLQTRLYEEILSGISVLSSRSKRPE